ncbi:MAG: DUF4093 domain-containing protein [Oscillospiraceae bacterium]|nr:DUF4093 domain-containing protein [Oscillospiraceae bacterium]
MLHIKQAIVVEGKYDKIKLSSITDAVIIVTNGFSLFKDKEKQALIRFYAEKTGIIILTDSDSAGFKIRNLIKNIAKDGNIINVYVPEIFGKEKRKADFSKEGKLGVEGIDKEIIINALEKAGVFCENTVTREKITNLDFYEDGLSGGPDSSNLRKKLLKYMDLPQLLSSKALLEIVNTMYSKDEYKEIITKIRSIG